MKRIRIEMTGSPKEFGFKTKEQFMEALTPFNVFATKITHSPDYLD
jgi:hypothetical protein